MTARLVTVFLPDGDARTALELVGRHAARRWLLPVEGEMACLTCIVQGRYVERLIDEMDGRFSDRPGFALVVTPIEAMTPPLYETAGTARLLASTDRPPNWLESFFSRDRLTVVELYGDVEDAIRLKPAFLFTVLASALIAGLGMKSGQTAIVIGAMVIAPFLGPSIGLAMAAAIGDAGLARRASVALAGGALLVLGLMAGVGALFGIDATVPELLSRSEVSLADIVLALTSGAAGVLAFSRGASMSLIGVMIAVALVPPLSAAGLFFGSGHRDLALGALFLFATNLVCINVAGIVTFLFQGLQPRNWRITAGLLVVWCLILALMTGLLAARVGFGLGQ
ncbi:MAG: TIGR00341 family protein [Caulobacter sp.]